MNKTHLFLYLAAYVLTASAQAESAFQPHESIYDAVREHVARHMTAFDYEVEVAPIDRQLRLPACAMPLETYSVNDTVTPGRNTIGVRCRAEPKWSIFSSAVIKTYQSVLVSIHALQRGETITRQHVVLERRDVSGLRGDYVSEFEKIADKQALRPIQPGSILSLRNIVEPKIIKRGDRITITSVQANFAIRMNGKAMMDGIKGQSIRIKNESSGRIITATVMEPGLVSVNP